MLGIWEQTVRIVLGYFGIVKPRVSVPVAVEPAVIAAANPVPLDVAETKIGSAVRALRADHRSHPSGIAVQN